MRSNPYWISSEIQNILFSLSHSSSHFRFAPKGICCYELLILKIYSMLEKIKKSQERFCCEISMWIFYSMEVWLRAENTRCEQIFQCHTADLKKRSHITVIHVLWIRFGNSLGAESWPYSLPTISNSDKPQIKLTLQKTAPGYYYQMLFYSPTVRLLEEGKQISPHISTIQQNIWSLIKGYHCNLIPYHQICTLVYPWPTHYG